MDAQVNRNPQTVAESDWLGTNPVFYHERTGRVSERMLEVIDWSNFEFDPDGVRDYLDFGYCVFGHTPVRHVRFLAACNRLVRLPDGRLQEERLHDPAERLSPSPSDETEVIELLRSQVATWANAQKGPIIVPTSGGYDSRLLNLLIPDKSRIRAYTYGISSRPERSSEVVLARCLARKLSLQWQQIDLGNYYQYLDNWDELFGPATHAHGMYHWSFYEEIARTHPGAPVLSGIIGDAWAKEIPAQKIAGPDDLIKLSYSHGLDARKLTIRLSSAGRWRREHWELWRERLSDPRQQVIAMLRNKLMLLRYLVSLPRHLGFKPWSPFLEPNCALAMLQLPDERRRNRLWQRDYFAAHEVDFPLQGSIQNSLNLLQIRRFPPPPLNTARLSLLFSRKDIEAINRDIFHRSSTGKFIDILHTRRRLPRLLKLVGLRERTVSAANLYFTLRPLDRLIARAENGGHSPSEPLLSDA